MEKFPSDEELMNTMKDRLERHVDRCFKKDGVVHPFFIILGECMPNGQPPEDGTEVVEAFIPVQFRNEEDKKLTFQAVKHITRLMRARFVSFVSENKIIKQGEKNLICKISEHPDRKEAIIAVLQTETKSHSTVWMINCPPNEKPFLTLDPFGLSWDAEHDGAGGIFGPTVDPKKLN